MFARVTASIRAKTKSSFRLHFSFTSIPRNASTAVLAYLRAPYPQSFLWRNFRINGKDSRRPMQLGSRGKANPPDIRRPTPGKRASRPYEIRPEGRSGTHVRVGGWSELK